MIAENVAHLDGPEQTTFHRVQGLRRSVESFREAWASSTFEVQEFIETGERAVVLVLGTSAHKAAWNSIVEEAWAYWVLDGSTCRIEQYGTKREALEAAGLSE